MKCPHCNQDLFIQIATKTNCKNCRILPNMTSIVTVQCDKCKHVFQIPIQSKSILGVKEDK
ncbi:MAG TPA: hypothetical protein ENG87_03650 [Candidatus Pacearchaeota archaeon]|nr:hypothetical protein BMS3Abin17_01378 [archaeon BMS3Abin17]HDK42447.1 hypothetical protein [Candidatus Pacearchaeota archaeon]HDZ61057.1 hypothetical protein [Candidatus Pacearchaeota archaeon]